ncbi:hypothetical protein [Clostridium botulinum]|uniref:hypothetical protein n=1 Tax=Clostridium botulinum TaxID=1491 RepID=UPI001C9B4741|nr:hypothetical protein [Clostridium botulinum]MBY6965281.1 hypothetical protein [Clostridium botulinum]
MLTANKTVIPCNELHKGNIIVPKMSTLIINGIVDGNIRLNEGSHLKLHGVLNGDLLISQNSDADVTGTIYGIVTNNGTLAISGTVTNLISPSDNLLIKPNAFVNQNQY